MSVSHSHLTSNKQRYGLYDTAKFKQTDRFPNDKVVCSINTVCETEPYPELGLYKALTDGLGFLYQRQYTRAHSAMDGLH
jgi:hypothetical protein